MFENYLQLVIALGVFILTIIALIILPIVISIKRQQNIDTTIINTTTKAVEDLNQTILTSDSIISNNFRGMNNTILTNTNKQSSNIKDMVDSISKGLHIYHNKTINAIQAKRNANKANRGVRPKKTGIISDKVKEEVVEPEIATKTGITDFPIGQL